MEEAKKVQRQNKWEKEHKERIIVISDKGTKDRILAQGHKSINAYINNLIANDLNQSPQK